MDDYRKSLSGPEEEQHKPRHDLTLDSRAGCPGVCFDWTVLEEKGLCSKADAALFSEGRISQEYGGFFRNPFAKLSTITKDEKILGENKRPYGVVASLQSDLQRLGYSVSAVYGEAPNGNYDHATQCAVDRFRRRYMHGVVPDNQHLSAIFDRATAIALKRVLLDRDQ